MKKKVRPETVDITKPEYLPNSLKLAKREIELINFVSSIREIR